MGRSRITRKQKPPKQTFRLTDLGVSTLLSMLLTSSGHKRRFFVATVIAASGVAAHSSHASFSHHTTQRSHTAGYSLQTAPLISVRTPRRRAGVTKQVLSVRLSTLVRKISSHYARIFADLVITPASHYSSRSQTVRGSPA